MQEILFLQFLLIPRDKNINVQRKQRNWIYKNELIDFGGQNETEYNRISFLVLLQPTFEKRMENKSEELVWKN